MLNTAYKKIFFYKFFITVLNTEKILLTDAISKIKDTFKVNDKNIQNYK